MSDISDSQVALALFNSQGITYVGVLVVGVAGAIIGIGYGLIKLRTRNRDGIFVSYRREDEASFAHRLRERLQRTLGARTVFMDTKSIGIGQDFERQIDESLSRCKAVLVVIGQKWVNSGEPARRSRLFDEEDFVRREVAAALARPGILVVPVLVAGTPMPADTELPDPLKPLARRNAIEVSHDRFESDVKQLISTLKNMLME